MKKTMNTGSAVLINAIMCISPLIASAQDYGVRIAFVGNSITYGAGLSNPATQSFPAKVGDLLEEVYGDTCVVGNFGVSARTMLKHGDFPIWDEPAFTQALNFKPNIVVIALGTNDTKPYNWDEYGDEFYGDYMSMIDTFKRINPYTGFFVCYPPPAFEIVWDIRDSVIVHGVIPAVEQIAAETGAALINFYTPLTDSVHLFPDYIHPDVEGSAVMARIVVERFTETDVIRQSEKGVTFVTRVESDHPYITSRDSVGMLSWTTINAKTVWLDGSEVGLNGSQEVNHLLGTTHTIIAGGDKHSDTAVFEFIIYTPGVGKITCSASQESMYTGDTIQVTAFYLDQHGYPLIDTVVDLQWSVSYGKGTVFGPMDNTVLFTSAVVGSARVTGSYMGVAGGVTVKVKERETTSAGNPGTAPETEVFPNPFNESLTFRLNLAETGGGTLKMIDLPGKTCIRRTIGHGESGPFFLDTNQLPEGIYFYELKTGKSVFTGKLVKNQSCPSSR
ncbi:MAG: GDSL-type esterase/lipase family protein [Bacteroidota bacterium]